ncbi:MAG: M15 family metallopeptidase [Bacilli bacterium]|nr:M15 family metallopeptidase [Bacilli bacterium]
MPTRTVKKVKLKPGSERILKIIGVVVALLLIVFIFYRSNINSLKKIGYSEKAAKTILSKFKKDYCLQLGENKTLNAAFESSDYIEKNLDTYSKVKYRKQKHLIKNINKLIKKKYSNDQISTIITHGDDKAVSEFTKRDKVRYLDEFYTLDYAKLALYDRYVDFMNKSREDAEGSVIYVNLDLDKENYKDYSFVKDFSYDMLINKHRALSPKFIPPRLVKINKEYCTDGEKIEGNEKAIDASETMIAAAAKKNIHILISSGYRSYDGQKEIENMYLKLYGENYVNKFVAHAGFSEHQTGLAFDFASAKKSIFTTSDEYVWMFENAYKYGFVYRFPKGSEEITGYTAEPWHFRYVGKEIAKKCHDEDITFDEYFAKYLY